MERRRTSCDTRTQKPPAGASVKPCGNGLVTRGLLDFLMASVRGGYAGDCKSPSASVRIRGDASTRSRPAADFPFPRNAERPKPLERRGPGFVAASEQRREPNENYHPMHGCIVQHVRDDGLLRCRGMSRQAYIKPTIKQRHHLQPHGDDGDDERKFNSCSSDLQRHEHVGEHRLKRKAQYGRLEWEVVLPLRRQCIRQIHERHLEGNGVRLLWQLDCKSQIATESFMRDLTKPQPPVGCS